MSSYVSDLEVERSIDTKVAVCFVHFKKNPFVLITVGLYMCTYHLNHMDGTSCLSPTRTLPCTLRSTATCLPFHYDHNPPSCPSGQATALKTPAFRLRPHPRTSPLCTTPRSAPPTILAFLSASTAPPLAFTEEPAPHFPRHSDTRSLHLLYLVI